MQTSSSSALIAASWNINSIKARLPRVQEWLTLNKPDLLLLQETKCQDINFPYESFASYNIIHSGQKSYNGVAIISKEPINVVSTSFPNMPSSDEARFIHAKAVTDIGVIDIINIYVPNGKSTDSQDFIKKLQFLEHLKNYLNLLDINSLVLIGGDFNVAPFDIDVYSPETLQDQLLCTIDERKAFRKILNSNFIDLYRLYNPEIQEFSWWDYRERSFLKNKGLRIDFLLANYKMADLTHRVYIDAEPRGKKECSDHTPVVTIFNR